jgi:membrane protease YdiL (CAAX protease family)
MKTTILSLLLAVYLILRFFFTQWLDAFGSYSAYILEVILIIVATTITWPKIKNLWLFNKPIGIITLAAFGCGYAVFKAAGFLDIIIPFDFSGTETLLFLLIIAPTLEELIFRFFAWIPFERLNKGFAYLATSLLFAYSHFHAYWFYGEEIHKFIFYQTAYTFLLALACGYSVYKFRSLVGAILIHFAFNLGFYLGFVF